MKNLTMPPGVKLSARSFSWGDVFRRGMTLIALLGTLASFGWVAWRTFVFDPAVPRSDVVLSLLQWGDAEETAEIRAILDNFSADYFHRTGRRVLVNLLQSASFDIKVYTMSAGGTPPDVFYVTDDNVSVWSNLGLLRDLDPLIAADRAAHGGEAAWLDDYYPELLAWFRFDGEREGRGPQYALPCWQSPFVMFVNADLFRTAGLEVPRQGWTWAQFDEATRRINALATDQDAPLRTYGAVFGRHQYATRAMIWNTVIDGRPGALFAGGRDDDDRRLAVGEPAAQAALERIRRARFVSRTAYNPAGSQINAQGGKDLGFDLFSDGRIGVMGPEGYWSLFALNKTRPRFEFAVVPIPSDRPEPLTTAVAIGWGLGAQTPHPEEAFALIKYLTGVEAQKTLAAKGLIFPANRRAAEDPAFLATESGRPSKDIWLQSAERSAIPYWPRIKGFLGYFVDDLNDAIYLDRRSTADAARALDAHWASERGSPRNQPASGRLPWFWLAAAGALGLGALAILCAFCLVRRWRRGGSWRQEGTGLLLIAPWLVGFGLLAVGPMAVSLLLSLTNWTPSLPLTEAGWVGLANYREMFTADSRFPTSLSVTLFYTALVVPFTQIVALALAGLLGKKLPALGFFRSAFFMPSMLLGVVVAALATWIFSPSFGVLNSLLGPVLGVFGLTPPDWLGADAHRWAVPALALMSVWTVGGPMLIYLAAIKGVPPHLYEAARIEGASRFQQLRHITLPMISPIIQFNVIMAVIGSFQVFTVIQVLTGGGPNNATLTYVVYIYNQAFTQLHMGYASALAWVLFAGVLLLTTLMLRAMRGFIHYDSLK